MKKEVYNFDVKLKNLSDQELTERFNDEVGNRGWGNARAHFLAALHNEFLKRDLDSAGIIISKSRLSLARKIRLTGRTISFEE